MSGEPSGNPKAYEAAPHGQYMGSLRAAIAAAVRDGEPPDDLIELVALALSGAVGDGLSPNDDHSTFRGVAKALLTDLAQMLEPESSLPAP